MSDVFASQVARSLAALEPPRSLLVAVSGGADSIALLHALAAARKRRAFRETSLIVGHVDHGLRPDSADDARLVAAAAADHNLPIALSTLDLGGRHNLEERARVARYDALTTMARDHGCGAIVTAHTATDQAETLLMRLARGAGARGLGGMRPSRDLDGLRLLRPMLGLQREETRAYCARHALRFHDDPTNTDERPRARLRAEVLPVLERLMPGATLQLAAAADRLRQDDDLLRTLAGQIAAAPSVASLRAMPPPVRSRALADWFEGATGSRRRLAANHLAALGHLIEREAGVVDLPSSRLTRRVALLDSGRLVLREQTVDASVKEKENARRRMKAQGPREH